MEGKILLIVIGAHSKWIEAVPVSSTSSATTIKVLRNLFATHSLPKLILDNGTAFTSYSDEFRQFVTRNGICHRYDITWPRMAWPNEWSSWLNLVYEGIHTVT